MYIRNIFRIYISSFVYTKDVPVITQQVSYMIKFFSCVYTKELSYIRNKLRIYETVYPSSMLDIPLLDESHFYNDSLLSSKTSYIYFFCIINLKKITYSVN